jgi:hypothetical protein
MSSSAVADSDQVQPSTSVSSDGDAVADGELRQLFEALTESLCHKVDPALLRAVASEEVELTAETTLFDVIAARASLLGLRMTRMPMTSFDLVMVPMHHLPLVV